MKLLARLNVRNLSALKRHGVNVTIGSDNYRETSVPEALYVQSLGVYSTAEVPRMWGEATPLAIFPARKIGRLEAGYEASFLALSGNPLDDFSATGRIGLRMKQGVVLRSPRGRRLRPCTSGAVNVPGARGGITRPPIHLSQAENLIR